MAQFTKEFHLWQLRKSQMVEKVHRNLRKRSNGNVLLRDSSSRDLLVSTSSNKLKDRHGPVDYVHVGLRHLQAPFREKKLKVSCLSCLTVVYHRISKKLSNGTPGLEDCEQGTQKNRDACRSTQPQLKRQNIGRNPSMFFHNSN